jgi:choline dehydrogenase
LRRSAADAFLRPACEARQRAARNRRLGEQDSLRAARAVGVEYARGNDAATPRRIARSSCARARSIRRSCCSCRGSARASQLWPRHGITPLLDNPAVGANLQDHLAVVYSFKATQPTLNDELHSRFGQLRAGLRYLLTRRGPWFEREPIRRIRARPLTARGPMCSCTSIR